MAAEEATFEVLCPECGGLLKIDLATRAVIAHGAAPRKKTFEDLEQAARALKDADARRESVFEQSFAAQKNRRDVLEKRFAEAMKKAKDSPIDERPLRDFDFE